MLKKPLKPLIRLAALPCILAIAILGFGNAAAYSLPGIPDSGFGFESNVSISWQKRGPRYVNQGSVRNATGDLFLGATSYTVDKLTFDLNADFDSSLAVGPGSFLGGSMQIKGTIIDDFGAVLATGTLFEAVLTDFNFAPTTPSDATLFGYATDITFCVAMLNCTLAESVYMQITDGQEFNAGAIFNGRAQSFAGTQTTTVPVPATVLLFGSGLLGMASLAKRRKRAAAS